ncbi:MAG: phosphate/phosphite/phosphonate ABC transporter substrate-binding protein [Pseudomonadota bacterium]
MTVQSLPIAVLKIILRLLCFAVFVVVTACQQQQDETSQQKLLLSNEKTVLTFLVHPYDTPSQLITRFQPLCDYLGRQLGQTVKLELASSYVDQIKRISNGSADFAYMGPTPFLRAQGNYLGGQKQLLTPLAAEATDGQAGYHSVIVVRSSSSLDSLTQLTGHSIAFGAPHSFGSHYAPRTMLASAGLGLGNLRDYAYLGSHERVALAVLHGDFDAGGLRQVVADKYAHRTPGLRIIATSPPLPPHLVVARPGLNDKLIKKVRKALLAPSTDFSEATLALGQGIYFVIPDLSLFDSARKVIQVIEARTEVPEQW